ncbi:type IV pilus biogenesis protein PilN [Klebsiella pneumoniae]|nr:type IV pilus biogenesis protein PilN [Klebsiella pneumoniae]HBY9735743.1 pilus assembly protein PilN [Klebsiella pneumoniae]HBY9801160.1 pilus assembly protein PilN [Klebsiella pneumoniae]
MTHVVNLLPWRDLRRRQRLRYVLLLTIGIVLLGGMGLLVSRTARLQRDFLATLHTTADAQLLASLKQREQAMREAWLTRLEYQGVLLTLDGLALNLQALTSVEAALTRVAGFAPAKAGGTQRDAEGRWQFSFTLTGARADAD